MWQILTGPLTIEGGGAGTIENVFHLTSTMILAKGSGNAFSGTATVRTVGFNAAIKTLISADLTGTIKITSNLSLGGTILVVGDVSSGGKIWVVGDCSGLVRVVHDLIGDVQIDSDLTSSGKVTVDEALAAPALAGAGRILVSGICDGDIDIGEQTDDLTLIHLLGGLGSGGSLEINASEGNFDANGNIHVGPTGFVIPDITFDGCIHIYDELGTGDGGNLIGTLTVQGCHDDDLDICIDGLDTLPNVIIKQTGCPNQVGWSCPDPPCP